MGYYERFGNSVYTILPGPVKLLCSDPGVRSIPGCLMRGLTEKYEANASPTIGNSLRNGEIRSKPTVRLPQKSPNCSWLRMTGQVVR